MLKALRHRPIKRLWVGQALSSVGDEIYRVGLTWLVVGLIGPDTGYLNAAQAAALMILSFIGGKWADNWDPLKTMVRVDFIRAGIVLVPVVVSYFIPVPLTLLVIVALLLSGLGAFFDPALQTVLPKFSPDTATLRAATGLMATTTRLARMVGPSVVGFMAGILPPIHFFTIDAISFLFSAESVRPLGEKPSPSPHAPVPRKRISFQEALWSGHRALATKDGMLFILLAKGLTGGTWNLVYGLGLALMVQNLAGNDARAFGYVIASYGLGNFLGALYFGNRERPRPALMMFVGFIWLGLGFAWTALCPTIPSMMLAVAVAGFSGTMNEVTFYDLIQARFPIGDMTKIFRLRMAVDTLVTLVLLLLAPAMFRVFGYRVVIALAGAVWVVMGMVGLAKYLRRLETPV